MTYFHFQDITSLTFNEPLECFSVNLPECVNLAFSKTACTYCAIFIVNYLTLFVHNST